MNAMDEFMIHGRISQCLGITRESTLNPTGYPTPSPELAVNGLRYLVQKMQRGVVSVQTEAMTMIEPYTALCPNCGSPDTLRTQGAQGLCPGCTQQRHQCRTCGQKFITFWDMTGARAYGEPGQVEGACHV